MLLRIRHTTLFVYEQPACDSHNEMRLRPLEDEGQRCLEFELSGDRPPAVFSSRGFFGNHAHSVSVSAPHRELTIVAQSLVERLEAAAKVYPEVEFRSFVAGEDGPQ